MFVHEFTHTRQVRAIAPILGPIDSSWHRPQDLRSDIVQIRFGSDSLYAVSYIAERDLLYRAAAADSFTEVRAQAAEALDHMRQRHARWFSGEDSVFATLDDVFLCMEGAAQWAAVGWLAHAAGGGLAKDSAVKTMLGRRRVWAQDEGLGLFLVVDRLLPEWQSLVFQRPIGAIELLSQAIRH